MQAFFSWFTSQSGVSLLVALVALIGVFITTWWNNRAADKRRRADQAAADKRRRADQAAADQRRKDDQAAADQRRKADDDRRERERFGQLQREDWARQRRAVADCLAVFEEEFPPLGNLYVSIPTSQDVSEMDIYIDKGNELLAFYRAIVRGLNVAELEVSNTRVKAAIHRLMETSKGEYTKLLEAESSGLGEVGFVAMKMNAIGPKMEESLRDLINVTAQEFLETPLDNDK